MEAAERERGEGKNSEKGWGGVRRRGGIFGFLFFFLLLFFFVSAQMEGRTVTVYGPPLNDLWGSVTFVRYQTPGCLPWSIYLMKTESR